MVQRDEAREGGGREGEGEKDLAIENIEDLAGAVVQRDKAGEGGGREGEGEEGRGAGIKGATGCGLGLGLGLWAVGCGLLAVGCGLWARPCLPLYCYINIYTHKRPRLASIEVTKSV